MVAKNEKPMIKDFHVFPKLMKMSKFTQNPIGAWYNAVPKLCFSYIQDIKSKNKPKWCYQKVTKFENVFKIGPEPIFWAF